MEWIHFIPKGDRVMVIHYHIGVVESSGDNIGDAKNRYDLSKDNQLVN